MANKVQEEAIRAYLRGLHDPDSLLDGSKVKEVERQLAKETDPTKRLELQEKKRKLGDPSEAKSQAKDAFVTHAKAWAEEKGISAESFRSEGVPPAVLREAGLMPKRGRGTRGGGGTRTRVSSDTVRDALRKKRGSFTINQLQEETGASVGMVRNVISEAEEAGEVTKQGPDPDHEGPGRAPILYKRT